MSEPSTQLSSGWLQPSGQIVRRAKDAAAFFRALPLKATDGRAAELVNISPGEHGRGFFFHGRVRVDGAELVAFFSVYRTGEFIWWTVRPDSMSRQ